MDKQTQKAVIAKNLENWYIIDSVLFNGHAREVIKEGKVFKEYIALKASLLSNLYEYWQHVDYTPVENSTPVKVKTLQESAVRTARKGKALASELLTRDNVKSRLKKHIVSESKKHEIKDLNAFQAKVVEERFKQFALDNCLIGMPLLESKSPDAKCNFECKILEDAHRLMRDNLVRLSMTAKKKSLTESAGYGAAIGGALGSASSAINSEKINRQIIILKDKLKHAKSPQEKEQLQAKIKTLRKSAMGTWAKRTAGGAAIGAIASHMSNPRR
jgi:hypothetical protein